MHQFTFTCVSFLLYVFNVYMYLNFPHSVLFTQNLMLPTLVRNARFRCACRVHLASILASVQRGVKRASARIPARSTSSFSYKLQTLKLILDD